LSTVTVPSAADVLDAHGAGGGHGDRALVVRKSPEDMVATLVLESADHAPMECGWDRAYSLTDRGARRSELPSRSTGFTALPLTLS
jgi:hypothetical protein